MIFSDIDYGDIQGLVRFGHGQMKEACYLLLKVRDRTAARSWLATAPVTTAVKDRPPDRAMQVAFTHDGLKALGVPDAILEMFSPEFVSGMAGEESRSRRLGDVGANDPSGWQWGAKGNVPDVLVLLFAKTGQLAGWQNEVEHQLSACGCSILECRLTTDHNQRNGQDVEPFGFADGVSQPVIDWERQKPTRLRDTRDYTNLSALGEFLLGYPNEYCRYTDRPLLDPDDDPHGILPLAEDAPGKRDLGRNGSYLVLRDLAQDVVGFWQFVDEQARHDAQKRERLAHAMVGRMRSGEPIVPLSDHSIPGVAYQSDEKDRMKDLWRNQFTFDKDPDGTACPFGAHIRRANPRNADLPAGTTGPVSRLLRILGFGAKGPRDDLHSSTRFHRILRRGREYGPDLTPERAIKGEERDRAHGLRFICLNANISRQFEFVQTAWIANAKFDGVDEGDPLLGNRRRLLAGGSTDTFTHPQDGGLCRRTTGLRVFVTVRGGAYFFMPGIRALRYIAGATGAAGATWWSPPAS
jgi:deferrochelatase/peroxidase EfeB